ncbi:hypothetical protein LWX53_10625, partial [bacterium]|nr:hypothetical protein [bacterium]
ALVALLAPTALFAQAAGGGPGEAVMKWLRENMGMEMGSVTINDTSYSKVVLQPEVRIGRLKLGFYLPVIYTDDLFDPSSWYQPGGNNEWDFGARYWGSDTYAAIMDTAADIILKVKYLEYGQPLEDPFFVKVGNLHDLTIGHGLIMRDYRNDTDFPAIRRIGVNTGFDFGGVGFEALANDLPAAELVGARVYIRPIKKFALAIGLSGVADLAAAKDLAGTAYAPAVDNFIFVSPGLDLDLPIIKSNEILSVRAFADAALTVPYVKTSFASPNVGATHDVAQGFQTDLVWNGGAPRNWGAAAGLMGNVLFVDWRMEYRYFTGIFKPSFYDSTYERSRSTYVRDYIGYLDGSTDISTAPTVMGVYGEAGFSLLKDKLSLKAGYMWPWNPALGFTLSQDTDDELHAALVIKKGLIPVLDVAGAVYYDKRGVVNSLRDGTFVFFDEKTAFAGEIEIPVPSTPNLAVGLIFKSVAKRDATTGNLVYVGGDPKNGVEMLPSITIETRFRF